MGWGSKYHRRKGRRCRASEGGRVGSATAVRAAVGTNGGSARKVNSAVCEGWNGNNTMATLINSISYIAPPSHSKLGEVGGIESAGAHSRYRMSVSEQHISVRRWKLGTIGWWALCAWVVVSKNWKAPQCNAAGGDTAEEGRVWYCGIRLGEAKNLGPFTEGGSSSSTGHWAEVGHSRGVKDRGLAHEAGQEQVLGEARSGARGEDPKSGRVEVKGGSGSAIRSKAAAAFDDAEGEDPYAWLNQEGEYPREAMGNWTGGMAQGEEAYPTDAFAATPTDPPTAGVQARVRVGEVQWGGGKRRGRWGKALGELLGGHVNIDRCPGCHCLTASRREPSYAVG